MKVRRQVGIRHARISIPERASAGPALIRSAQSIADREFEKLSDQRTQEAQVAAAKLNFERNDEGHLVAPSLPIADNGLLAPSIYDRVYTQMVGQRYLNQIKIDTNERIATIATNHWDDPSAFREVAEAYVQKVTDLAPDHLKPDVNTTAQIKMVEHFNHITRVKAERDHAAAKGVHLQAMGDIYDDVLGYAEAGAEEEAIAKMQEFRAKVAEGSFEGGFNYFTEDEMQTHLETLEDGFTFGSLIGEINSVPDDELAYAEMVEKMTDFGMGKGKVKVIGLDGEVGYDDVENVFPNPEERNKIATHAIALLNQRATSFSNVQDKRLQRDWERFYDVYSPMALNALRGGEVDLDWLFTEFDKAHRNVLELGYDDQLREEIRRLIGLHTTDDGSWSQERQDFDDQFRAYWRMYGEEDADRYGNVDPSSMSPDDIIKRDFDVEMSVGNIAPGSKQTAGNTRWIGEYYSTMSGRKMHGDEGYDYWNQLLQNPSHEGWNEVEWMAKYRFNKIGLWPQELTAAIQGKLRDVEGMNQETLDSTLRLARIFWDEPTFRANMTDGNALGRRVGGALNHMFRMGGQPTVAEATEYLKNFGDPDYRPQDSYNSMDKDAKADFDAAADSAIDKYFSGSWIFRPKGLQAEGRGFNPFDEDVAGVPFALKNAIMQRVIGQSGFIDPDDPDQFIPFIHKIANETMRELGYATSELGYSPMRYGENYFAEWTRPDTAIVQWAPEYFARDPVTGNVDRHLMGRMKENMQVVLDWYGDESRYDWDFVAGKNAALEYNAEASARLGRGPAFNIRLIRDNGIETEYLTETGITGGDRVILTMEEAMLWNEKRKEEKRIRQNEITQRMRTDFQNGLHTQPRMYGPIQ